MADKTSHEQKKQKDITKRKKTKWLGAGILLLVALLIGIFNARMQPINAFGGAVWLKNGPHILTASQIADIETMILAPEEKKLAAKIQAETPFCIAVTEGFCQPAQGEYVVKTLVQPAVAYQPGTPDRKELIDYCTLCNDGEYSPSCSSGRGTCSHHDGVAIWDAPRYRTVPGTPAVPAKDAVYSYESKTYKDSLNYYSPPRPSLSTIVNYKK